MTPKGPCSTKGQKLCTYIWGLTFLSRFTLRFSCSRDIATCCNANFQYLKKNQNCILVAFVLTLTGILEVVWFERYHNCRRSSALKILFPSGTMLGNLLLPILFLNLKISKSEQATFAKVPQGQCHKFH